MCKNDANISVTQTSHPHSAYRFMDPGNLNIPGAGAINEPSVQFSGKWMQGEKRRVKKAKIKEESRKIKISDVTNNNLLSPTKLVAR